MENPYNIHENTFRLEVQDSDSSNQKNDNKLYEIFKDKSVTFQEEKEDCLHNLDQSRISSIGSFGSSKRIINLTRMSNVKTPEIILKNNTMLFNNNSINRDNNSINNKISATERDLFQVPKDFHFQTQADQAVKEKTSIDIDNSLFRFNHSNRSSFANKLSHVSSVASYVSDLSRSKIIDNSKSENEIGALLNKPSANTNLFKLLNNTGTKHELPSNLNTQSPDLKNFTHLKELNMRSKTRNTTFFRRKTTPKDGDLTNDTKKFAGFSLFIFSRVNKLRLFLFKLVENFYFDIFIMLIIITNSIILAFGLSFNLMTTFFDFFDAAEYIFLCVYTLESLFKIIAYGFTEGEKAYIKDSWNKLDFVVMVVGLVCLLPGFESYKELKIFRTFRPLRSISFMPGLKNLVTTLANSIRQFFHLFLLFLFFFLLYGVLGVTIWAGLFSYRCRETPYPVNGDWKVANNSEIICGGNYQCPANYTCSSITEAYDSSKYFLTVPDLYEEQDIYSLNYGFSTFDNMGAAFLTIFQCATLEGWSNIMYSIQNGYNYYSSALFFISLVIILNYFVLNFTIAIMMDSCKSSHLNNDEIDEGKISRLNMKLRLIKNNKNFSDFMNINLIRKGKSVWKFIRHFEIIKRLEPQYESHRKWKILYYSYVIINQPIFRIGIYFLIVVNIISLALIRDDDPVSFIFTDQVTPTKFINYILVAVFTIESLLTLFGEGIRKFFQSGNNIFDLMIVIISILEVALFKKTTLAILRVLRVYRLLDLLNKWKTLSIIMKCITATVVEMGYYVLLLFIFIYVFALVGMNSFKGAAFIDPVTDKLSEIDTGVLYKINFENMFHSMIAVFTLIIGDNWFEILHTFLRSPKTNKIMVYFYFISVIVLMNIIMMNLVIAFLVYIFEISRKKYHFLETSHQVQEYMRKSRIKTSLSFTCLTDFKLRSLLPKLEPEDFKALDDVIMNVNNKYSNGKRKGASILTRRRSTELQFDMTKAGLDKEKEHRDMITDKLLDIDPDSVGLNKSADEKKSTKLPHGISKTFLEAGTRLSGITENISKNLNPIQVEVEDQEGSKNSVKRFYTKGIQRDDFKKYIHMKTDIPEKSDNNGEPFAPSLKKKNYEIKTRIIEVDEFSYHCDDENKFEKIENHEKAEEKDNVNDKSSCVHKYIIFPLETNKCLSRGEEINAQEIEKVLIDANSHSNGGKEINVGITRNVENLEDSKNVVALPESRQGDMEPIPCIKSHDEIKVNNFLDSAHKFQSINKMIRHRTQLPQNVSSFKVKQDNNKQFNCVKYFSESSLLIFHKDWRIRKFFARLLSTIWFDNTMIFVIVISNFVILLDNPFIDPESAYAKVISIFDDIFTVIFFVEMIMKIISFGLIFDRTSKLEEVFKEGDDNTEIKREKEVYSKLVMRVSQGHGSNKKRSDNMVSVKSNKQNDDINKDNNNDAAVLRNSTPLTKKAQENNNSNNTIEEVDQNQMQRAYLRSIFNLIDSFVIITSIIYLFNYKITRSSLFDPSLVRSIKTLRAMRALRPLRMINRFTELKLVVKCLIDSVPAIINMLIIGVFVFFVYAVIGLNLFHGTLGDCSDPAYIYSQDCLSSNSTWTAAEKNFDTISSSLLTVFELATTSGWFDVMNDTIKHNNEFVSIFFISFMLIGSIFVMNLSVTVIVDNFITVNEIEEGISMITEEQKEWVKAMKYFLKYKPVPSFNTKLFSKIRLLCYKIVSLRHFNTIINWMILCNVIIMCVRFDRSGTFMEDIQSFVFYSFSFLFTMELILKLIAFRRLYFIDVWNKFDCIVVVLSNVSIFINIAKFYIEDQLNILGKFNIIPVLIRAIRILRVFRLLNINDNVKNYFYTLLFLFPSLINIGSLVLIILTIFSIIGMNLFGTVKLGDNITENNNFQNFVSSFIFLIRTTTGDNWNDSMHELGMTLPGCLEAQNYASLQANGPQGCGGFYAFPFFISFMILNSMVIMNLFIAVVVDSFITNTETYDAIEISDIRAFFELWGKYDLNVAYRVEPQDFVLLMMELPKPLGIQDDRIFQKYISQKLTGNIYVSHDNKLFADDRQCMKILTRLKIEAQHDKIHIVDAIKLVTKRAIVADKIEVLHSDCSFAYEEKISELEKIEHERFNKKLNEKFVAYNSNYENDQVKTNNLANLVVARRVIEKFLKLRREKKKQDK